MAKPQLRLPCLALVTDRSLCQDLASGESHWRQPLAAKVAQAVRGGVGLVQLREKDLPAAQLLALAQELRAVTAARALLVINDRLDVALAAGPDIVGVHLPEEGLPVAAARRLAGHDFLIGRSVHSVQAAVQAQEEGADYLFVGTIFPSRSHPNAPTAGPVLLRQVAEAVSIPFLAIGGVVATNVGEVMRAGASGAAVISAILASPSPEVAARDLWAAMTATPAATTGEGR